MKRCLKMTLILILMCTPALAQEPLQLDSQKSKASYSLGVDIGRNLLEQPVDLEPEAVARGVLDVLSGNDVQLSNEEIATALAALGKEVQEKQQAAAEEKSAANMDAGNAFLKANAAKDGVVVLPSGLQYKVLEQGQGPRPSLEDTVTVHYRGTLIDGTEFDSSYQRGQPAQFPLKGIIPGWQEALQLMPQGSKWQLVIPPDLAYGENQAGPLIGPNSVLIFEVELLDIK